MKCPRCGEITGIEQSSDSNYKIIKCYRCDWWSWLKNLNKK